MTRFFRIFIQQFVLIILFSCSVFSSTITQTYDFNGIPNYSNTYTFSQFNPSKGFLDSVEIALSLNIGGGCLKVDNDGIISTNGTANFGAKVSLSSSDVTLLNSLSQSPWQNLNSYSVAIFDLSPDDGDGVAFDSTAPDGDEYNGIFNSASIADLVKNDFYAAYTGTGTYNINLFVDQYIQFNGLGGISYSADPVNSSGSLTVKYNYVPEPATIGILGFGSIILLLKRNK